MRIAVIGVGHLGQAHARILAALPDVKLVGVADANLDQAELVAARHQTQAFSHFGPLLDRVDAACIVVPTSHHYSVATAFLECGIHVLIEKPLAPTVEQADSIVDLAHRRGCVVQVGHIERFNPAFEALASRPIRPKFIVAERYGPFTGRSMDIGAVLDLMVHDLDLVLALDRTPVVSVDALGIAMLGEHEDAVNARLRFTSGCVADLTVCRVAPQPQRRMQIWSLEGFAAIDFSARTLSLVQPSEVLRRRGMTLGGPDAGLQDAFRAQLFGTHLQMRERVCESPLDQLTCELRHFVDCARTGSRPRVSGEDGRNAVALACRVIDSLREHEWEGPNGPKGPSQWPATSGTLFDEESRAAA